MDQNQLIEKIVAEVVARMGAQGGKSPAAAGKAGVGSLQRLRAARAGAV